MNIKFFAYATTAILIGLTVMMLPLALETGPPTYNPTQAPSAYTSPLSESGDEQRNVMDKTGGLASQPPISSSSLILLIGLIIAFAAYLLVKKQVNPPPTFSNSYKLF